jgi:copper homeostasis protein
MRKIWGLEVIGFTIDGCINAQKNGAKRIELCDNPFDGGTTPSYGFIQAARKILTIDLNVIIKPRGGDFFFNDEEFNIMCADVEICKQLGCDGVVIGMLLPNGSVDKERCKKLVALAYPMNVTFQRAFDRVNDAQQALEDVIETGCDKILTSGLQPTALQGAALIKDLILQADERIIIMPGSGIKSSNIEALVAQTGAIEYHASCRIFRDSNMQYTNPLMNEKLETVGVDGDEVKKIVAHLNNSTTF